MWERFLGREKGINKILEVGKYRVCLENGSSLIMVICNCFWWSGGK